MGKALPPPAREGRRVLKAASGREGTSYRPGGARRSMPVGQQGAPAGTVTAAERPVFPFGGQGFSFGKPANQGGTAWLLAPSLCGTGLFVFPWSIPAETSPCPRSPAQTGARLR